MTPTEAFNKKIEELIEGGETTASKTIDLLVKEFPHYRHYYHMLDSLAPNLGFEMIAEPYDDSKTEKTIGYIPKLRYNPNNKLNEKPGYENLGIIEPIKLSECYEILAKGCLYRLTKIPKLIETIKNQ